VLHTDGWWVTIKLRIVRMESIKWPVRDGEYSLRVCVCSFILKNKQLRSK
jgi:uncharacterized C2H2 Zn-finger protein